MKKIVTIIVAFFLLGGMALQAAPVSKSRALEVARKVFAARPATKAAGEVKLLWDGEDIATKSAVQPALYVFTRDGGGFVIVAGDDNVQPVLALSDRNEFKVEGMPANVRWWMETMKASVRSASSQSASAREMWSAFVDTKSALSPITDEFLTSRTVEWTQGAPFNGKAPTLPGQSAQAVSGCLPLAMAEILTWFGSPTMGTGTLPDYQYSYYADDKSGPYGNTITGYTLSTTYDWVNIKGLYTSAEYSSASASLKDNVAQLVYDCGVMLQAQFSSGATNASDSKVVKAFGTYMGYNKAAKVVLVSDYSPRNWEALLKTQVAAHPVLYCGYAPASEGKKDASHAYVLDGYAKYYGDDVFHFNFGWGSYCNGYYYLLTQPVDDGYNFNADFRALIDFYPGGEPNYPVDLVAVFDMEDSDFPGIKAFPYVASYYMLSYSILNRGSETFSGNIKFAVKKQNGEVVDIEGSTREIASLDPYYIKGGMFGYVEIPSFKFGDKVICLFDDNGAWKQLTAVRGEAIAEWPLAPAAFIDTKDSYDVGDWFQFELTNHDYQYAGTVWTITEPDGTKVVKKHADFEYQLTKAGEYRIEAAVAPALNAGVVEILVANIMVGNIE